MNSKPRWMSLPLLIFLPLLLTASILPRASADDVVGRDLLVLLHPIGSSGRSQLQEAQIIGEWEAYIAGLTKKPPNFLGEELEGLPLVEVDFLISDTTLSHQGLARDLTPLLDGPRSRLHRYLAFQFSEAISGEAVLPNILGRPEVLFAELVGNVEFASAPNDPFFADPGPPFPPESYQWGAHSTSLAAAWNWSKGGALIGVIDSGLDTDHPDLVGFNGNQYVGGNYLDNLAYDYAANDFNVDEVKTYVFPSGSNCLPYTNSSGPLVGHGTHVAGILAAATDNGLGVAGTCPECKLYVAKYSGYLCNESTGVPFMDRREVHIIDAIKEMADLGVQVLSMSFGVSTTGGGGVTGRCIDDEDSSAYCVALELARRRGIVSVAASGNDRSASPNFPARDWRVIAVGGTDSSGSFWDDWGTIGLNCPTPGVQQECGSNYTGSIVSNLRYRQELVAPAKSVFSTFYPNRTWVESVKCMDNDLSHPYDDEVGYGLCTGTSMSTPFVAGIAALVRSLNPLLQPGVHSLSSLDQYALDQHSVRGVLANTTREAQMAIGWDGYYGYGLVDAGRAVEYVLGTVGGETAPNRAIPLFGVYSSTAMDYAYSTSPQAMISFRLRSNGSTNLGYDLPVGGPSSAVPGDPVPDYPAFPDPELANHPVHPMFAPRASMYVLAGHKSPLPGHALLPLYRMTWKGSGNNRDVAFVTSDDEINSYYASGYKLERLEGYIYDPCCQPIGTEPLFRMRNASRSDYALALESQEVDYLNDGYTRIGLIGFAYATTDNDEGIGDGIPDGFELALGLDPTKVDSDCDGDPDGVEWPIAGLPVSDPLDGECDLLDLAASTNMPAKSTLLGESDLTVTVHNISSAAATSVTVQIKYGSPGGDLIEPTFPSGPGNCTVDPPPPDPVIGSHGSFTCLLETGLSAGAMAIWSFQFDCTWMNPQNVYYSIEVLDAVPADSNPANDYAYGTGGVCGSES